LSVVIAPGVPARNGRINQADNRIMGKDIFAYKARVDSSPSLLRVDMTNTARLNPAANPINGWLITVMDTQMAKRRYKPRRCFPFSLSLTYFERKKRLAEKKNKAVMRVYIPPIIPHPQRMELESVSIEARIDSNLFPVYSFTHPYTIIPLKVTPTKKITVIAN